MSDEQALSAMVDSELKRQGFNITKVLQGPTGPKGAKGDKGEKGEAGPQGPRGEQGPRGMEGPIGPRGQDGERGERGPQGPQGIQGPQGSIGLRGEKGDPGVQGLPPRHEIDTVQPKIRFENPNGTWGEWIDLKRVIVNQMLGGGGGSGTGGGVSSHLLLTDIGINTHDDIDIHIADTDIHFEMGDIAIASTQVTDFVEAVQDVIGNPSFIGDSSTIDVTYNDGENTYSIAVIQGGIDHGSITGISDDDHTQYALLLGRSGGQTLIGGTAASNNLILRSTSNATKGQVYFDETTASTSVTTGAVRIDGGLGVSGRGTFGSISSPGSGTKSERFGPDTSTSTFNNCVALGNNVSTGGDDGISIGVDITSVGLGGNVLIGKAVSVAASCTSNVVIGSGANISVSSITQNVVIGAGATSSGASAMSIGALSSSHLFATALGNTATASGIASMAFGSGSTASGANASAFGSFASATGTGSTVIGAATSDSGFAGVTIIGSGTASAANQLIFGSANDCFIGIRTQAGAVSAKTINVTARTGTNVANAGNLTLRSGLGTGTGARSIVAIETPIVAASGTTPHTFGERIRFTEAALIVNENGLDCDFRIETETNANFFVIDSGAASGAGSILIAGSTGQIGFFGATPVAQSTGWSVTNETTTKTFDADATSIDELADVLGTLIEYFKTIGLLGA